MLVINICNEELYYNAVLDVIQAQSLCRSCLLQIGRDSQFLRLGHDHCSSRHDFQRVQIGITLSEGNCQIRTY